MKIPSLFYGQHAPVRRRVKSLLGNLSPDAAELSELSADLDVRGVPGLIQIESRRTPLPTNERHVFLYLLDDLFYATGRSNSPEMRAAFYARLLRSAWGLAAIVGTGAQSYIRDPTSRIRLGAALLPHRNPQWTRSLDAFQSRLGCGKRVREFALVVA
jgi:hypothetical protein